MSHSRLWVAATIIAGIILAGFIFLVPHTRDIAVKQSPQNEGTVTPTVALSDTFKKGVHTITGTIEAPNACTSVGVEATPVGTASSTEGILVAISMPEDTGICLQVPTTVRISTTIEAPAHLPITATVNGASATTTTL